VRSLDVPMNILVLETDAFACSITQHLRSLLPGARVHTVTESDDLAKHAGEDASLVAAARTPHALGLDDLHRKAFSLQIRFIPITLDAHMLRIGPISAEGCGGCWSCWRTRRQQHELDGDPDADQPQSQVSCGEAAFALLAAARIATVLRTPDRSKWLSRLWEVHTLSLQTTSSRVIGVHGCKLCGLHRPEPTRSVSTMRDALSWMFSRSAP
jgi:bacteriocin biosynthesis cyclodehydratase domain-containing protein